MSIRIAGVRGITAAWIAMGILVASGMGVLAWKARDPGDDTAAWVAESPGSTSPPAAGSSARPNGPSAGSSARPSGKPSPSKAKSAAPSGKPRPGAEAAPGAGNARGCAESPSRCGYPDETNTGWRHTGVTLKTVNNDPYTITKAGAVVDGLDIRGCVVVRAKNVTIRRSRITCSNQPMVKNWEADGKGGLRDIGAGLVVEDVEFDGKGDPDAQGLAFNSYTVRRAHFHNLGAGAKLGSNVRIEDSYISGIASTDSSHNSGFPSDGGAGIILRHNTVLMDSSNGHALAIYNQIPAGSVVRDVIIEDNLLAGGNYILYCGAPGQPAPNLRVTGNRFSNAIYAKGGFYGPTANCDGAAVWQGNIWDGDGKKLAP